MFSFRRKKKMGKNGLWSWVVGQRQSCIDSHGHRDDHGRKGHNASGHLKIGEQRGFKYGWLCAHDFDQG